TAPDASNAGLHPWYISPVPRAPIWESIATGLADNPAQTLEEASSPTSSGGVAQANTAASEPSEKDGPAWDAPNAGWVRRGRRVTAARSSSTTSDAAVENQDEPSFRERARLNRLDSYYRGTLFGAARLMLLKHLAATLDPGGIN
ncbi:hypothetical protein CTJ10_12845, partial [Staphylococcus epidermidis]